MENLARAWGRIGVVCESDVLTDGFKQVAKGRVVFAPFEVCRGVTLCLAFGGGQVLPGAVLLGFDHAYRIAVDKHYVVGCAIVGRVYGHCHARPCGQVELLYILNDPASLCQLLPAFASF